MNGIRLVASQQVQQSDSVVAGGGYIPNLGFEPKVIGYAFNNGLQLNAVSPGIKGMGGVYFISVLNRNVTPLPTDQNMLMQMLGQARYNQQMQLMNGANQVIQQAIVKKAEATYNVDNF